MSHASTLVGPDTQPGDATLYRGKVALVCLFVSEAHMFGVLLIAYLTYLDQSLHGDTSPAVVLKLPLAVVMTVCLLASSVTVALASSALQRAAVRAFYLWWAATILLALLFLAGTAYDWTDLIGRQHVTLGRNLFGTTYFSLIGLHASHVTFGALAMLVVLGVALREQSVDPNASPLAPVGRGVGGEGAEGRWPVAAELLAWYWHFVDGVWVVIFCLVYLYGR